MRLEIPDSEDQAELVHYAVPNEFPYLFPDTEIAPNRYSDAFTDLLIALDEGRAVSVERPYDRRRDGG